MTYVALLRGINVGGNNKVPMAQLKQTFEQLGLGNVTTFIASGNVMFTSSTSQAKLTSLIEAAIHKNFGFPVKVLLKNLPEIKTIAQALPDKWVNDKDTKCDVMFLWPEVNHPHIVKELPSQADIEDIKYVPGAVIWRIDRDKATKSKIVKIIGTKLYKQMTIRNANSVRKIYAIMVEADDKPIKQP